MGQLQSGLPRLGFCLLLFLLLCRRCGKRSLLAYFGGELKVPQALTKEKMPPEEFTVLCSDLGVELRTGGQELFTNR